MFDFLKFMVSCGHVGHVGLMKGSKWINMYVNKKYMCEIHIGIIIYISHHCPCIRPYKTLVSGGSSFNGGS